MATHQIQLRLRVFGSPQISVRSLLAELAESCRVVVRAVGLKAQADQSSSTGSPAFAVPPLSPTNALDVELQGPISAIQCLLSQLQNHPVTIQGKGNPDSDGWHY